ncbi:MAG: hypothetical protein DRI61_13195, partial [Chloroflexi bacterium]
QDSDTASVVVTDVEPGVEVSKVAEPASLPEPGGEVTFTVRVSNTGVEAVTLTSLTDSAYGDLDGKGTCSTGGTITAGAEYTCVFTDSFTEAGTYINTVTAAVQDNEGNSAQDSDTATVTVTDAQPAIEVTKEANPTVVQPNTSVSFTISVRNLSVEPVALLHLEDSAFGDLTTECGLPVNIAVGGSFRCLITRSIGLDHTNIVTATVEDNEGNEVTDTAQASVNVIAPAIKVTIEASVAQANVGDTITYTYTAENIGDVTLTGIKMVDDRLGDIALSSTTLLPGETSSGSATYVVTAEDAPGALVNNVTVSGTPPIGPDVSHTDTVSVQIQELYILYLPIMVIKH